MAYNELIKNYEKIRSFLRDFYVFGFRGRGDYTEKSGRSYDDERRRIESWMGEHTYSRKDPDGKKTFISIDSRVSSHNPLYNSLKAKSFTDGDITLHFILMDILFFSDRSLCLGDITDKIYSDYLGKFDDPAFFDDSTVRKKLKEYVDEGLIKMEKRGKTAYYSRTEEIQDTLSLISQDALDFFSEVSPCGVVGSFLLDKFPKRDSCITFKHHYITHAPDSEILCRLFEAIGQKHCVIITNKGKRSSTPADSVITPLKIYASVQNGRQYLLAYHHESRQINTYRIDYIKSVTRGEPSPYFDSQKKKLSELESYVWGVNVIMLHGAPRLEHVEFTVRAEHYEEYIVNRLQREKRCGTVEQVSENIWKFSADVFDTYELVTWIRTFICRITSLSFSNKLLENQFKSDILEMARQYGIEIPENGDVADPKKTEGQA
ncbi:MAG: WYL domain-containing protein [Clostridia bacterium]|nr:WYL domain-containing protein [Clostridia bacterium]